MKPRPETEADTGCSLERMVRLRSWKVKRVVVEMYSVEAASRAEAIEAAAVKGNPYSVTIKSETATPDEAA
jgi:hypothetical protein